MGAGARVDALEEEELENPGGKKTNEVAVVPGDVLSQLRKPPGAPKRKSVRASRGNLRARSPEEETQSELDDMRRYMSARRLAMHSDHSDDSDDSDEEEPSTTDTKKRGRVAPVAEVASVEEARPAVEAKLPKADTFRQNPDPSERVATGSGPPQDSDEGGAAQGIQVLEGVRPAQLALTPEALREAQAKLKEGRNEQRRHMAQESLAANHTGLLAKIRVFQQTHQSQKRAAQDEDRSDDSSDEEDEDNEISSIYIPRRSFASKDPPVKRKSLHQEDPPVKRMSLHQGLKDNIQAEMKQAVLEAEAKNNEADDAALLRLGIERSSPPASPTARKTAKPPSPTHDFTWRPPPPTHEPGSTWM